MKKVLSILLAVVMTMSALSVASFADDKAMIHLEDTAAYEVVKDETKIIVPICVHGTIDMQCYDITVTYDSSKLDIVAEETYITLPTGENEDFTQSVVNTSSKGTVRFSGMTVEESAKTATGVIGQIVFTSSTRVRTDGVELALGLSVAELGFGTEVADIDVDADAVVTLNKSPKPASVTLGDVNNDNSINATDALAVLKHAAKIEILTGDALEAADVIDIGTINAEDALQILKKAAKLIEEF